MVHAWSRLQRQRGGLSAFLALAVLVLTTLVAIGAPLLAPNDPSEPFRDAMLQAPSLAAGGHWLGTDELGRDVLSRLLHGARITLGIAFGAVLLAALPGVLMGLLAAFYPRLPGTLVLRVADVLLALPGVLLAMAVVAVLGPSVLNTMLAVALSSLPGYVRLVRASALGELARPYVLSARAVGAGTLHLMFRTVLPNCLGPVVVAATLDFSSAILTTAGLGFLGLGAQPPAPEWGTMLAGARDMLGRAHWVVLAPGLAILLAVLCVNVLGDALRDILDPRRGSSAAAGR
jgi:dipeptide transport system permease protein